MAARIAAIKQLRRMDAEARLPGGDEFERRIQEKAGV
jgi:hypothetical protein